MANRIYPCTLKAVKSGIVVHFESPRRGTVLHSGNTTHAVGITKDSFWYNMHHSDVWEPYSKRLRLLQALKEIK